MPAEPKDATEHDDAEPFDPAYEEAWNAEIRRRADEALRDDSPGVPWEQVHREALERLTRKRSA